jgi:hypothetical protein
MTANVSLKVYCYGGLIMSVSTPAGVTWTPSVSCQPPTWHNIRHLSQDASPVHMVMQPAIHPAIAPERDKTEETPPYSGRAGTADVRLVGLIGAGDTVPAEEMIGHGFHASATGRRRTLFLLRVSGDS